MLNLQDVSLRRGTRLLLHGASVSIHAGQKVGLIGANGAGKSSLLALIRGELDPDGGELRLPADWVIAHVAQETPAVDTPAIDYVMEGDTVLKDLQRRLREAEALGDGHLQAALHARLDSIDAYGAESRAAKLMAGLGFVQKQLASPVAGFSGGWRMRLNLARALMRRSDLLMLDEPTNHLDLDAVLWLEEWLRGYPGALILISHDRDFLDRVTHHILHIEAQRLTLYPGNYSDFEMQRAAAVAERQAVHARQQREIESIRRFVDRFRAKATKARQAQSRLKALARMELVTPAHLDSPFRFSFPAAARVPNPLLTLDKAQTGYQGRIVLSQVNLTLHPGDRLALLGANGAGKSTLIRLLAGQQPLSAGKREPSPSLQVGYFAQHQLEQLIPTDSPLQHLSRVDAEAPEQALRDFLGGFGFGGDAALTPVENCSGGEKARLVLALIVRQQPHLLLLDEPTNHLDLEMRHALSLALLDFEGALVLVSHDRHLIRTVADRLLLVSDGTLRPFDGDLDDYARWLAQRRSAMARQESFGTPRRQSAPGRKEQRRDAAEQRRRLQPLRDEVRRLEASMDQLASDKAMTEARLTDPVVYEESHKQTLKDLLISQARLDQALAEAEQAWLSASEALEAEENDLRQP